MSGIFYFSNMQEATPKERMLKKIRKALIEKAENPFPKFEDTEAIFASSPELLEIQFAEAFNKVNGQFVYCEDEKDFLEDLVVETSQALETANTYTTILSSSLDAFASIISNNQNEVLKRLTTLTIFLSIPVLIASIYGMNVPIPYQTSHYAFWVPVILAFAILAFAIFNYWKRFKK